MITALAHTRYMTVRAPEAPRAAAAGIVAITIVQPIIWLLLFGALFKSVVEIPGFGRTPTSTS